MRHSGLILLAVLVPGFGEAVTILIIEVFGRSLFGKTGQSRLANLYYDTDLAEESALEY